MSGFDTVAGLHALRDFFIARDADEMRSAAQQIADRFRLPLDAATDWQEVEYDYNRLFVGPLALPSPPYASAYQEDPVLMAEPALAARTAYNTLGLSVPDQGTTPDDHLAFELDAVAACNALLAQQDTVVGDEVRKVCSWFVTEHMAGWIPRFIESVKQQPRVTQPVIMAVYALELWLATAIDAAAGGQPIS